MQNNTSFIYSRSGHIVPRNRIGMHALLVLPGLGFNRTGRKAMLHSGSKFAERNIDLYVCPTVHRGGIPASLDRIKNFVSEYKLSEYKCLYIFAYIAGWLVLNPELHTLGLTNLRGLVLDRSPTQERAPAVAMQWIPWIAKILFGAMIPDLALHQYQDPQLKIPLGLFIETRPTSFVRLFRQTVLSSGKLDYNPSAMGRAPADFAYVHLDHLEMYSHFLDLVDHLVSFIQTGNFSNGANRIAPKKSPL